MAAFLLLPSMASIGMFLDGILYAAVSRNLAEGTGSSWAPHFSDALYPFFVEHPPFVFWVQSLAFRALGDSYLTERVFDLLLVVATAVVMVRLWVLLVRAAGQARLIAFWWLPMLAWVLVPKWSWTYRNNMLENTLALLALVGVWLVFGALRGTGRHRQAGWTLAASFVLVAALLTKGPPALFLLAAPALLQPATGAGWPRVAGLTLLLGLSAAVLLAAIVLLVPEARELLTAYWQRQVLGRVGFGPGGLGILPELVAKLVPMLAIVILALLIGRRQWRASISGVSGPVLSLTALGLSASLPLVLADRDSAHYLVPALPLFALAFGLTAASLLAGAGEKLAAGLRARPGPTFMAAAALSVVLILGVCIARLGEVRKNVPYHELFAEIDRLISPGPEPGRDGHRIIGLDPALYSDWYLHAIAQRHHRLVLDPNRLAPEFLLSARSARPPPGCPKAVLSSGQWTLWRCRAASAPAG